MYRRLICVLLMVLMLACIVLGVVSLIDDKPIATFSVILLGFFLLRVERYLSR